MRRLAIGLIVIGMVCAVAVALGVDVADAAGVTLGVGGVSMFEGNAAVRTMRFTVTTSAPAPSAVSFNYTTVAGSARAGSDFTVTSGRLAIGAGRTAATIDVPIHGDTVKEPDEKFSVVLSKPVGASIAQARGVGTIVNDDPPSAAVLIGVSSAAVTEGATGKRPLWFAVTLSKPSTKPVVVSYATAPRTGSDSNDFVATAGKLAIPAGHLSAFIAVPIAGDASYEPDETFSVVLSHLTGARFAPTGATGVGTIVNDDPFPANAQSWGDNQFAELGDPAVGANYVVTPHQLGSVTTWKSVATSGQATVAIRTDGTLWAWGRNDNGQLGDGGLQSTTSPEQIGTDTNWSAVSEGGLHTVALKTDGTLWAWGDNFFGELGEAPNAPDYKETTPTQVGTDTNWAAASAGNNYTLAVKTDGTLWGWGANSRSQVGITASQMVTTPTQVGSDTHWQRVSVGSDVSSHSLAVKTDGTLWAWGDNSYGQLGDGTQFQALPEQIGTDTHWASVSAGASFSTAVKTDGTLWAWGRNDQGQLGDGTTAMRTAPVQIGTGTSWSAVSAGNLHAVALKTDGTLWAWGHNDAGSVGDGTFTERHAPVQIGIDTNWMSVNAGSSVTVAVKIDGTLWAWGYNVSSLLGFPTQRSSPGAVGTPGRWRVISAGADNLNSQYAIGIKADGTLWGWGFDSLGNVGDGTGSPDRDPVRIGTATNWVTASAGGGHTLAVKTDGTLWAWGRGGSGQLGDGLTGDISIPEEIDPGGLHNWQSVSVGGVHSLAIKRDGSLWAWGDNTDGQLGDGTTTPRPSPKRIGTATNWATVYAGPSWSFALKTDGSLWAWGNDHNFQLGDGGTTDVHAPKRIGAATNWKTVSTAGDGASFAIKSDGSLWAWGLGALGFATPGVRHFPTRVDTATNWDTVSAGPTHAAALKTNGTLWAWGDNSAGQLGDGATGFGTAVPEQIGTATDWDAVDAGRNVTYALTN